MTKKTFILILILFTAFISADFAFSKEKCNVSSVIKTGHPNIEQGKIPIGEAVDESELLAQNLINEMENIINEIPNMRSSVENLYPLPPQCKCPRPPCSNSCIRSYDEFGNCIGAYCSTCSGCYVCPKDEIAEWVTSTANIHSDIDISFNKINNLIEVKNLIEGDPIIPDDPNRWKILNKLIDSREKFEKCITGYKYVKKQNKQQEQLFSCDIILREKYVNKTAILGYFESKYNKYPHCYPFTIEVQEEDSKCKHGRTAQCLDEIVKMELMDNYFCCKGE